MKTYFTDATLIDCTGVAPQPNLTVGVEGDKIIYIGKKADCPIGEKDKVINCTGKYLMPGMINMHEHLSLRELVGPVSENLKKNIVSMSLQSAKNCLRNLQAGITTVRECGSVDYVGYLMRDCVNDGDILGPRVYSCGKVICTTGGHFPPIAETGDGIDEIMKVARKLLGKGADFIKCASSTEPYPMPNGQQPVRTCMKVEEMKAAFDVAHEWGKLTAVHAIGEKALWNVIAAGVDCIEHGAYMTDEIAACIAEKGIFYTPTFSGYTEQTIGSRLDRGTVWRESHMVLRTPFYDAFKSALRNNVRMLIGTDGCGIFLEELELFQKNGMSAMDSLLCATKNGAEALGLGDKIGTVETGKQADLIVVDKDPLDNPYNLEKISIVMKEGISYETAEINLI